MSGSKKRQTKKGCVAFIVVAIIITAVIVAIPKICKEYVFPQKYSTFVTYYSNEYGVDENLIYAVIWTESGFNKDAESDVGARGLMQLMEDSFDWVKYRMGDESDVTFDDLYTPEYSIKYGTYLLKLLLEEFEDVSTAIAAYHTGRGNVNTWLENEEYSANGKTLDVIPSSVTEYYVKKVNYSYECYNMLYD